MSQTESKIKSESPTTNNNSSWKEKNNSAASYENGVKQEQQDQATTSSSSADSQTGPMNNFNGNGPDPAKLKAILDRTGYNHQVSAGQRKYGGPPPDWPKEQAPPQAGCEVFVGKIPREVFEDELIPLFEKIGKIWDLRLMVDPTTSQSRGYGFITYCNKADAQKAVSEMDGHKIRKATLKVNISVPNVRLFVGNIPKIMSKEQIFTEFEKVTEGLVEVITYSSPDDRKKNRGFCFLEFDSHKNASSAKRKLSQSGMKMFKCDILVDWADPQEEPDEETMSKVKVLYVRNLTQEVNESQLKQLFEEYGSIERVKKIKDYAFVHFDDREHALEAMDKMNGKDFCGSLIEISLAKPPSDRKKKEEVLRNRERRMLHIIQQKQFGTMFGSYPQPSVATTATAAAAARAFRPPLAMVPPIPTPAMMMNAAAAQAAGIPRGRNRYQQPVNPLMPMSINRPGQSMWNPMMYYNQADMWGRPSFPNFPNMAPGWEYFANGQVPPHLMAAYAGAGAEPSTSGVNNSGGGNRNNGQNRRNNNVNGSSSNNNSSNNANSSNRKFRKSNNNNSSNSNSGQGSNSNNSNSNNTNSNAQSSTSQTQQPAAATTNGQASSSGPSTPKK